MTPNRDISAALLVTGDGRYLLQLRDDFAHIYLPAHWGLFGGSIEEGETAEEALRREIHEEIGYTVTNSRLILTSTNAFQELKQTWRVHFFEVPIAFDDIETLQQNEGAGRRLFTVTEASHLDRIAPWDLCAMIVHARQMQIWPKQS